MKQHGLDVRRAGQRGADNGIGRGGIGREGNLGNLVHKSVSLSVFQSVSTQQWVN